MVAFVGYLVLMGELLQGNWRAAGAVLLIVGVYGLLRPPEEEERDGDR
jgi:hypothetical protein